MTHCCSSDVLVLWLPVMSLLDTPNVIIIVILDYFSMGGGSVLICFLSESQIGRLKQLLFLYGKYEARASRSLA